MGSDFYPRHCSQRFLQSKIAFAKICKEWLKLFCEGIYRYVKQIILDATKQIEAKVRF